MKYLVLLSILVLPELGCNTPETITRLVTDQKLLKDSADNINKRIGVYIQKGIYDSAMLQKKQLSAVYTRLAAIQAAIDDRTQRK